MFITRLLSLHVLCSVLLGIQSDLRHTVLFILTHAYCWERKTGEWWTSDWQEWAEKRALIRDSFRACL